MVDARPAMESDYINADLIENSETKIGVIMPGGKYEETDFGRRLTVSVDIDGKQKIYRPNKDSVKNLIRSFGEDTDSWVQKTVLFQVVTVNGKNTVLANAKVLD